MRRLLASSDFRAGFVEMLPACIGLVPFGLVCGVGAAAAGASWLAAFGMGAIIFSGAAQVLAGQLLAGGAPLLVIVLTCFVLGLRFLMYSAAMAPYLKALPGRWQQALAFLLTDQAFAAAIRRFNAEDDPHAGARHFLGSGMALWLGWQVTNMVGFFAGSGGGFAVLRSRIAGSIATGGGVRRTLSSTARGFVHVSSYILYQL